jgi:hypothetical protein
MVPLAAKGTSTATTPGANLTEKPGALHGLGMYWHATCFMNCKNVCSCPSAMKASIR